MSKYKIEYAFISFRYLDVQTVTTNYTVFTPLITFVMRMAHILLKTNFPIYPGKTHVRDFALGYTVPLFSSMGSGAWATAMEHYLLPCWCNKNLFAEKETENRVTQFTL